MSVEFFLSLLVGVFIGHVVGQVALAFFDREIFAFFDRLVARVRRFFGLPE